MSEATVHKLKPAMDAPKGPAIGYSIIANLGEKRQMTVQYFVDGDEPLSVIHANVDRTLAVLDRQIARYEIGDLKKELADLQKTLLQAELDRANLDVDDDRKAALRKVAIEALQEKRAENFDKAYEEYTRTGRTAPFALKGSAKIMQDRIDAEIATLKAQGETAAAEREQAHKNLELSLGNFRANIAIRQGRIDELEALIAG